VDYVKAIHWKTVENMQHLGDSIEFDKLERAHEAFFSENAV
jgi:hypothetical protein